MNQFYYSNNTNFTGHVQRNTVFENTVHPKQIVEQIPMTKEIGKMLPEFGLVNMNGRMYDPMLARMLSPDPFVTNPSLGQDYNRYSYVRNNPLKYTDPSGYIVNGGNNVFFNSLYLHAGMISKEREWWNNNLDKAYHRGDYALIGGFGGTNATFAIGGSVLNVGSVAGGFLGDGSMVTQQGKDFVKSHTGYTPVNKGGVWGYWERSGKVEGTTSIERYENGNWKVINLPIFGIIDTFVPLNASGGGGVPTSGEINNSRFSLNWTDGIGPGIVAFGSPLILKNSAFAKMIWSKSRYIAWKGNTKFTSLASLSFRGIAYRYGWNGWTAGTLGKAVPYVGWAWIAGEIMYHGSQENTWHLHNHGIDPYNFGRILNDFKCFAAGTKVTMGDMTYKNIENIAVGDSVLTYNFKAKKLEVNIVQQIEDPIHHRLIKITFRNGENIISTDDHPYYVKGKGWCSFNPEKTQRAYGLETEKLEESDFCFTIKKNKLKRVQVIEIIQYEESIKTYNLSKISNSNNYFVNGILVHNESK